MASMSFGQASYSCNSFIVSIMADEKRKYDYDIINNKITDIYGNTINDKEDEALIKKMLNSPEFKNFKEFMLEKKEDNELVH